MADVILDDAGRNKIAVIKVIRELTHLGLKEAKDLADRPGSTVLRGADLAQAQAAVQALAAEGARARVAGGGGGTAAAGSANVGDLWDAPAAAGGAGAGVASGQFNLWLIDGGRNKIAVIKEVRVLTGWGLKEARDLVDSAPQMVAGGLDRVLADKGCAALTTAGARAEVRPA